MSMFGNIDNPLETINPNAASDVTTGLPAFITNVLQLIFVGAGIFVLINLVVAGINYISAGSDEARINDSWQRIINSLIGLAIMTAAVFITGIVSYLLFGRADAILRPTIFGPGSIDTPSATIQNGNLLR